MRTSNTGRSDGAHADAGFTLAEVLVTMAILGLMVGAVLLMSPGPERAGRAAVERFAASLSAAQDESILTNRPVALVLSAQGYGYAELDEGGWQALADTTPLGFRPWPATLEAELAAPAADASGRVARFEPTGFSSPLEVRFRQGPRAWQVSSDGQGRPRVEQLR